MRHWDNNLQDRKWGLAFAPSRLDNNGNRVVGEPDSEWPRIPGSISRTHLVGFGRFPQNRLEYLICFTDNSAYQVPVEGVGEERTMKIPGLFRVFRFPCGIALGLALVACAAPNSASSGTRVSGNATVLALSPANGYTATKFGTGTAARSVSARNASSTQAAWPNTPPAGYPGITNSGGPGAIISGPPNYIIMNLTQIALTGTFSTGTTNAIAWSGNLALKVDGVNPVDTSGITLSVPTGTVTSIALTFANPGIINGQVTGTVNLNGVSTAITAYTNSAYPYLSATPASPSGAAVPATGGASSYTSFTSPTITAPQDVKINFGTTIVTQCSPVVTIAAGQVPSLTLLFDLSRMLRFYDGLPGNQGGGSLPNNAYFLADSLFIGFTLNGVTQNVGPIAAFFGTPGSIQGYSAVYSPTTSGGATNTGWMTLVFDSGTPSNILYGLLIPDDDNGLVNGKGTLGFNAPVGGVYSFSYYLGSSTFTLTGFQQQTVPGAVSPTVSYNAQPYNSGYAYYTLQLSKSQ